MKNCTLSRSDLLTLAEPWDNASRAALVDRILASDPLLSDMRPKPRRSTKPLVKPINRFAIVTGDLIISDIINEGRLVHVLSHESEPSSYAHLMKLTCMEGDFLTTEFTRVFKVVGWHLSNGSKVPLMAPLYSYDISSNRVSPTHTACKHEAKHMTTERDGIDTSHILRLSKLL